MTANKDNDAVIERMDALIGAAESLANRAAASGPNGPDFYAELAGWRARAVTAIASIFGKDHPYYTSFENDAQSGYDSSAGHGAAILRAIRDDIEAGYLRRQEDLVAASVFSDFLDMAGDLLEGVFYHAAA
jgi:hypothetical protein